MEHSAAVDRTPNDDPVEKDYILASSDQVAIDAVAAKMMDFDPLSIKYLRLAHEDKLGCADPGKSK